jgi:hypothetical protein
MVVSLTTLIPVLSSSPVALIFACLVPILRLKTAKPSESFPLLTILLALLFHVSMPPYYWAEALSTATYLFNILPT